MAGYSGTPLPQKLGMKAGHRIALVHAPGNFAVELDPPGDVTLLDGLRGSTPCDVILLFVRDRKTLARTLARAIRLLKPSGGLWIAWPKKASGVATDMTENVCRELALPEGIVDNKVCAIDTTWSGLRFVWRKSLRPKKSN
jgi:hypothetical protein